MDTKRKTCDIRTWKKNVFLDIPSPNIDTHVPSLYQCVETRSKKVFWLLSQPLPHLRFNLFVATETFATLLWTALRDKHFSAWPGNISLWISFALSPLVHKKCATETCSSVVHPQARSPFLLLKPASQHARLIPRLSGSWTVLLPSDPHRTPITSITVVLLPFVTYLLTLSRIYGPPLSRASVY
jgi:hypothetical protein